MSKKQGIAELEKFLVEIKQVNGDPLQSSSLMNYYESLAREINAFQEDNECSEEEMWDPNDTHLRTVLDNQMAELQETERPPQPKYIMNSKEIQQLGTHLRTLPHTYRNAQVRMAILSILRLRERGNTRTQLV